MITYGFYDSKNHDRKYNAIQFGRMFDGIIKDGIFMSIGECFRVIPGEGMMLLVSTGRAWFNHTWTLNDAPHPIELSMPEILLDRIDAVVLDIDERPVSRKNDIIVVKGTPSSKPQTPSLINNNERHQYPLAYISVRQGVTEIRAADITSMIGTSETPYVTGILETVNIDALLDQWRDQWREFFEKQTKDMVDTNEFWKQEWRKWFEAQTREIQESYLAWEREWELWSNNYKDMMNATADEWKSLWSAWFYSYINENQEMISTWQSDWDIEIRNWYNSLKVMLDDDVAANLAKRIVELESCCQTVKDFMSDLTTEHAIYDVIYDSGFEWSSNVLDSDRSVVLDHESNPVQSRDPSSEPILDNYGRPIEGKVIFMVK